VLLQCPGVVGELSGYEQVEKAILPRDGPSASVLRLRSLRLTSFPLGNSAAALDPQHFEASLAQ
jgi:hypothetical protein